MRTSVTSERRRRFVRVGRLGILTQGLRALVVGIALGGGLFTIRDDGFRLGMRTGMLDFVGVGLRGGKERKCWIVWEDDNTLRCAFGMWDWRIRSLWDFVRVWLLREYGHSLTMDIHLHNEIESGIRKQQCNPF